MAEPIEMPLGLRTRVGPRNHVLDGESDNAMEMDTFWRKGATPLHAGAKILLQQNPPVINWGYQLTPVVLYNGRKTVVVIITTNATAISSDRRVVYYGSIRGQPGYAGYALSQRQFVYEQQLVLLSEPLQVSTSVLREELTVRSVTSSYYYYYYYY